MKNKILPIALLIIAAVVAYKSFTYFFEYYEEEVDAGYSTEARKNPFLAAEYFLEENGIVVKSDITQLRFSELESDSAVLITDANTVLNSPTKIQDALDWVARGGYLIISADDIDDSEETIFAELGLSTDYAYSDDDHDASQWIDDNTESNNTREEEPATDEESTKKLSELLREQNEKIQEQQNQPSDEETTVAENNDTEAEKSASEDESIPKSPVIVTFTDIDEPLEIAFDNFIILSIDNEPESLVYAIGNEYGTHMAQYTIGDGYLTVLSEASIWHSYNIGKLDNAWFLLLLTGSLENFYITYNVRAVTLQQLVWGAAPEIIIALGVLLVIWLWQKSIRTGRVISLPAPEKRAFRDHITAVAEFHMANNNHGVLLSALKADLFDEFRKREPLFDQYDLSTQATLIAQWSRVDKNTVRDWLSHFEHNDNSETLFVRQNTIANTIRKNL